MTAKKQLFKKPKHARFGRPWAGRTGWMGQKGAARLRFGPRRTSGASFVKIGLGPPTVLRPFYVQSLLRGRRQNSETKMNSTKSGKQLLGG